MNVPLLSNFAAAALLSAALGAQAFEALPAKPPVPAGPPPRPAPPAPGPPPPPAPRPPAAGTVFCFSCHNVMSGGTDNRLVLVGVAGQKGGRSSPTVWNAAFLTAQFWDGRAATLEDQAKGPILNPVEMGMPSKEAAVDRIKAIPGYTTQFKKVFGGSDPVSYDNIAMAIASYERTLVTPNSAFDRYVKGDKKALSPEAQRGMKLVESVGCTACHNGSNFAGPTSLPVGEGFYQKFPTFTDNDYVTKYKLMDDHGRFEVTKDDADKHMWRVPTWRNVALTAPYFHNGSVATLEEAVHVMAKTQLNKDLTNEQVADIVAFLNSLTGEYPKQALPRLPDTPNGSLVADR